jgi:hypothetical protein
MDILIQPSAAALGFKGRVITVNVFNAKNINLH